MGFLKNIYVKYNTFILYAIYGIPPTFISFGVYWFLTGYMGISAFLSNGISWILGVIISFFLYRRYVFKIEIENMKQMAIEFAQFCSLRVFSGLSETGFIYVFVDKFRFNSLLFKVIASFLAALLNYFVSKILIFAKKKHKQEATN